MSYHRPVDLAKATDLLRQPGGKIIAGGTDVYPAAQRGRQPDYFLDVTAIEDLKGISYTAEGARIGAAVTWSGLASAPLGPAFDALKACAREVGSVQIQNAATLAGNLCNASPAADGVPPLLALDAQVELVSAARGTRRVPLTDFLKGARQTDRAEDEILTAILIPPLPKGATSAFEKLGSRRYLVISITMTAVVVAQDNAGNITHARIAVGACSAVAQRLETLEQEILGQRVADISIAPDHLAALAPIDDVRGSADYRLDVVAKQCHRALQRAAS